MRIRNALAAAAALLLPFLAGCALGGTATVNGKLSATSFDILSDVTVTITQGDFSFSLPVPVAGSTSQEGSFIFANVPAGTYAIEATFEADQSFSVGTQYRLDGGAWMPVDGETVSGTAVPYTFTITIDEVAVGSGLTLDLFFGDGT